MRHLIAALVILLSAVSAHAATLQMPSECADLAACFAAMSPGDTLEIAASTYTGANNAISASNHPPAGTSTSAYTTIKSASGEPDVIFDGESTREMFAFGGTSGGYAYMQFWKFQGIQWVRSSGPAVSITYGVGDPDFQEGDLLLDSSYIYFKDCGFHSENGASIFLLYIKNVLIEDCWGWGSGRYIVLVEGSDDVVVRRFVGRNDAAHHDTFYPVSTFMNYASHRVSFQNCISIDVDSSLFVDTDTNGPMQLFGGFYVRETWAAGYGNRNSEHTSILGSMVVNNDASSDPLHVAGLYTKDTTVDTTVSNFLSVGSSNGIVVMNLNQSVPFDHVTVINAAHEAANRVYAFEDWGAGSAEYFEVTNSAAADNSFLTAFHNPANTSDYNGAYGNLDNTLPEGTHNVTSDPGILYPVRIETGSSYKGVASDSGDIGATILKRYGMDGTFYGEAGYNTLTATNLWLWPNEDAIKTAFSHDYGTTDETRGFCADTSNPRTSTGKITLTSYVWEYLGNTGMTASLYSLPAYVGTITTQGGHPISQGGHLIGH